jgi:cytochrome P450
MPSVEDEIYHAYEALMPPCQDWTKVPMAETFTAIISRASNRMLGGTALSRNTEWTSTSVNFTDDTWLAAQRLKRFHPLLRPIVQAWIPEMARVRHHGRVAQRVIMPIVKARLEQRRVQGEKWQPPLDLLQMLWDGAAGKDKSPEFMAYTCLAISFAAIRTSSSVPVHLLYDLCARPEYIQPLRDEIESVLSEEGGFTKAAFNKLVKLDSFMKESQRYNPLSFLTFGRLIHHDLQLQDGIVIPRGTLIGIPAHAVAQDPRLFPGPFSGFRFVPHAVGVGSQKPQPAQFVTTNASNLSWGYGKHACSGRFFAANEIKILIAHFIVHFDFKFGGGRKERPRNLDFELQSMADPTVEILVRRRGGVDRH